MEKSELECLRERIDEIDSSLLALFLERMETADAIGVLKRREGRPLRDETREAEILARIRAEAGEEADGAEALFRTLFRLSRERQARNT